MSRPVLEQVLRGGLARPAGAVAAIGIALAGCSSSSTSSIPGMSSLSSMFSGVNAVGADQASAKPPDFECPSITIRPGAGTLKVGAGPADESALTMRYQVGIGETARECKLANNIVTMRVGVQGRVILGPAGGPGQVDVPLRYAVVHEGPNPKTIVTKLERINVAIPAGDPNVLFTHIEEALSFPMPRGSDIDAYVVYIGFDPAGLREQPRRPERRPPPRRPTG